VRTTLTTGEQVVNRPLGPSFQAVIFVLETN
jgi:hypothetical protein